MDAVSWCALVWLIIPGKEWYSWDPLGILLSPDHHCGLLETRRDLVPPLPGSGDMTDFLMNCTFCGRI